MQLGADHVDLWLEPGQCDLLDILLGHPGSTRRGAEQCSGPLAFLIVGGEGERILQDLGDPLAGHRATR